MSSLARSVGIIRGKARVPATRLSAIEETLALHIRANHLPRPEREYRFDEERRWRFDFAWPDRKLAVECEGGVHRIEGRFTRDCEKYNAAQRQGWIVLRFTSGMVKNGDAIATIQDALA